MADILKIKTYEESIDQLLNTTGSIFKTFDKQDSNCISYGIKINKEKYLLKFTSDLKTIQRLKHTIQLHKILKSEILIPIINDFKTLDGFTLVYPWVEGENLNDYSVFNSNERETNPNSPLYKFRQLSINERIRCLDKIFRFFIKMEKTGIIAVDFYDGCILYNFQTSEVRIFDIDEFEMSEFILDTDRLPGSSRYMAPEEFEKGAKIDHLTNVFLLGQFLHHLILKSTQRNIIISKLRELANKATQNNREQRYWSISGFYNEWQEITQNFQQ